MEEKRPEILPNEPLDLSDYHPSIRAELGDGMPLMTMRSSSGAKVLIFGCALPKTKEENERNWARAWETAYAIARRAGERAYREQQKQRGVNV